MRGLVVLLALVGCGSSHRVAPAPAAPDAAVVVVTWRGPNLYALTDGTFTVAVTLSPPGGWQEEVTAARVLVTSPAGSTLQVTLAPGPVAAAPTRTSRAYHHEHPVTTADGVRVLACDVALADADLALLGTLTRQCAELPVQQDPAERAIWTLVVEPATVTLATRSSVTVTYGVTNRTEAPFDAKAYALEWQLDGVTSLELGLAFGNGAFEAKWTALPPGDTVTDRRTGVELVGTAGDHVLSLRHLGRELARATFRVTR